MIYDVTRAVYFKHPTVLFLLLDRNYEEYSRLFRYFLSFPFLLLRRSSGSWKVEATRLHAN